MYQTEIEQYSIFKYFSPLFVDILLFALDLTRLKFEYLPMYKRMKKNAPFRLIFFENDKFSSASGLSSNVGVY